MGNEVTECADHALQASWAIQEDASSLGFDWDHISGVLAKVREELGEIEHALETGDPEHAKRELGDLLFAAVNLARFLDARPWEELHRTNARFTQRFDLLKEKLVQQGLNMNECSLDELDVIWEQVKQAIASRQEKEA